jgi:hypothetical protein
MINPDVEKILDLLVLYYRQKVILDGGVDKPIPLSLLTSDERAFIIEHSLLSSLLN